MQLVLSWLLIVIMDVFLLGLEGNLRRPFAHKDNIWFECLAMFCLLF